MPGGRLAYLSKLARSRDIMHQAAKLRHGEKAWLLTHIGLIPDFDDDAQDEVSAYIFSPGSDDLLGT